MSLNALTTIFAGLCGIALTAMAFKAPSIVDEMQAKGDLSVEQVIKCKKFARPACIIGALCSFGAAVLGFLQK